MCRGACKFRLQESMLNSSTLPPALTFTGGGSQYFARLGLLLGVIGAALVGCGYSHTPLFPDDVQTVSVEILENKTFYRGVEFDLTEAIAKQIDLHTPYKVVSSGRAQTLLKGTILSVQQHQLSRRRRGGVPQELEMRIVINFQWKNLRTGRVLRDRQGFTRVGRYIPTTPIAEPLETAQHDAVQKLAQGVVSVMRANW